MWTIASSSSILAAMGMKSVWLSPLASILRREHDDDVDGDRGGVPPPDSDWHWPDDRLVIAEMNGLATDAEPKRQPAHFAVSLRALLARLLRRGSSAGFGR